MVSNWQARFQGIFCPGKLPYFERATKILTCLRSRKTENPLKPSDFGKEKRQQTFYQNLLPYLAEDMGRAFADAKPPSCARFGVLGPERSTGPFCPLRVRAPCQKIKRSTFQVLPLILAEDMGLEPTRPFSPTRFPGELLSHSVNPPRWLSCFAVIGLGSFKTLNQITTKRFGNQVFFEKYFIQDF